MEELRQVAEHALDEHGRSTDWAAIKSTVKTELSDYLYKKTKRKPHDPSRDHGGVSMTGRGALRRPPACLFRNFSAKNGLKYSSFPCGGGGESE